MLTSAWLDMFIDQKTQDLVHTLRPEDVQVLFEVGDRVCFSAPSGSRVCGTVEKLNPKRASVRCDDGNWVVPYIGLHHLCEFTARVRRTRADQLREVVTRARDLMDRHGLEEWSLRFNGALGKLGECRSRERLILLSRHHAISGPPEQVTDTILHEIAHALAGPEAGHGPAWKDIACRIGAIPKSCAPESDEKRRHRQDAKERFSRGDAVSFIARGKNRTGTIERMNPKRAKVKCREGVWQVPYEMLDAVNRSEDDSG